MDRHHLLTAMLQAAAVSLPAQAATVDEAGVK